MQLGNRNPARDTIVQARLADPAEKLAAAGPPPEACPQMARSAAILDTAR